MSAKIFKNIEKQIQIISIDLNNLESEPTQILTIIPTNRGSPLCIEAYLYDAERISIGGEKIHY